MQRMLRVLGLLITLHLSACGDDDPPQPTAASVAQWERFEAVLPRTVGEGNPFDPASIAVDVVLQSPSGRTQIVPAFVHRDFTRELVGGYEKLQPSGELQWRVRFSLAERGHWSWRWRVTTVAGVEHGDEQALLVTAAARGQHGLLRRSRRDHRYLEYDDGTPFWAVGENLAWYDGRGTFAYDDWLAKLAAQGCNFVRLWMPSWAFGLEWTTRDGTGQLSGSSLGNYTTRLDRAWQLDQVIAAAQRHGIQVMLAIQNHGPFSLESNSQWADNPYNAANGGPLTAPHEFFTDPRAVELFKRRLRYIVARWGHATNIMTWELWNEVDLADQPTSAAVAEWHVEMARELRRLDPHQRLISTSTAGRDRLPILWTLPEIDYVQIHYYSFEGVTTDFPALMPGIVGRFRRFDKPILLAEVGVDLRGPAETLRRDPDGEGFHEILWSGLISDTFGSGMSWWWDNVVDPQGWYFHFAPLATLTAGVDFPGEGFVLTSAQPATHGGKSLRVFSLQGANTILVWIKNGSHTWLTPDLSIIHDAQLELVDVAAGNWRPTWIDTRTNQVSTLAPIASQEGRLSLAAPDWRRDIALRLDRAR